MSRILVAFVCATVGLSGCAKVALSPDQIVGDQQTNLAIEEFLYASNMLAGVYGLSFSYERVAFNTNNNPNRFLGFQIRSDIPYNMTLKPTGVGQSVPTDNNSIREYYIKAGAYASILLCRNYLSGLRDRNEYFEYLQTQLGIAGGLATTTMSLVHANNSVRTPVELGLKTLNLSVDEYEKFRFLAPNIETLIPVVELAQVTLRDHFLKRENSPTTFAGTLDAISRIEFQCTRSGIRALLNKTLTQGIPQFEVKNGIIYAKSNGTPPNGEAGSK